MERTQFRRKEVDLMKKGFVLDGLGCADCAAKMEREINKLEGVDRAQINFVTEKLEILISKPSLGQKIIARAKEIISIIEPEVVVKEVEEEELQAEDGDLTGANTLVLIFISLLLFSLPFFFDFSFGTELILNATAYLLVGFKVLKKAFKNILRGQVFDENFLMSIATIGAFAIGEFAEGVAVMVFYRVGEYFQDKAVDNSRRSIKSLLEMKVDKARLKKEDEIIEVDPKELEVGDIILVKAGERIPVDAEVIEGDSMLDTSALTGESVPKRIRVGEEVLSGTINLEGLLTLEVIKVYSESTLTRILKLVEESANKKAKTENFITKFASYYTPLVVGIALLLAIIPPILLEGASFGEWVYRALVFLVISCPCALVVSIPLSFFGGIGSASRNGILIKGGNYLEALNNVKTVVFDKTGTLTEGVFEVIEISPVKGWSKEDLLRFAAYGENNSNHPIAKSIIRRFGRELDEKIDIRDYKELRGMGVKMKLEGKELLIGNSKLMDREGIDYQANNSPLTLVNISYDGEYLGQILIADKIREESKRVINRLRSLGVDNLIMLTGDKEDVGGEVSRSLDLDEYYGDLLPKDKVMKVEEIINKRSKGKEKVVFVGDGINDAPVLARADIGVAMGGLGSDAAVEASDMVLMDDKLEKLAQAVQIAQKTNRVVWQNIILSLGVKGIVMILGAFGLAGMWEAVFADVGVALIAILNAIRIIKF
ncbi:heavy metal translocating P-type ATPase [Halonatronum saccharophilum]|uniref:heavy metal translocating P-type ATPase n=1 Tax=Halonatronum saccharophilum TaxID=150060 RepID=UPI0004B20BB9|nr:heavy metal translocating P-type ATPase [Halonatronum saccharophilum]